tara:strand:- start:147 stop:764 length:618 start_codon:yes stop_codon:yes gene_type:complete
MSDVSWVNKPSILLNEKYIYELYPQSFMSKNRKINAISRLIIMLTLISYLATMKLSYLLSGIISLGLIYIISFKKKEGFKLKDKVKKTENDNPLNNAMIGEDSKRLPADNAFGEKNVERINNSVKAMIQEQNSSIDNIDDKLFRDLGENLEFDRSMRQFYSTANTTTPNDQQSFADFCYGDMISAKEGNQKSLINRSVHLHSSHL